MIKSNGSRLTRMVLLGAFIVMTGALSGFASTPHMATLIRADGSRVHGKVRYLASSRSFEIYIKTSQRQIAASQVARVVLDKPVPGLQAAVANVKRGNYAVAVPVLKKIISDYEMFGPDVIAAQYLARAYLGMGKTMDADRLCREIISSNPKATDDAGFVKVYWDVLLKGKKFTKLKASIDQIVRTGSRPAAASALIKRGDVFMAQGKTKDALREGYLRVVLMFRDVPSVQPEALYKAIKAHEKIGEHTYAEKWRKLLLSGYPNSSYAKKL